MKALQLFDISARSPAKPTSEARPRNRVWDALEDILGFTPLTTTEQKLWGKVVQSFLAAGATAESLRAAAQEYRREWPDMTLTITALEKHYSQFAVRGQKRKQQASAVCPECGVSAPRHSAECSSLALATSLLNGASDRRQASL